MIRLLSNWLATCLFAQAAVAMAANVTIEVSDVAGNGLPCRIHVNDARGLAQRAVGAPFWRDHFVCPGHAELDLKPGSYTYEVQRGPEYRSSIGRFELKEGQPRADVTITLERIIDLAAEGWWSGDLHVHRALEEMPLHLRAEDLHFAPVITWWNDRNQWRNRELPIKRLIAVDGNRFYDVMGGEDEREGGALLYFGLREPLPLPGRTGEASEYPSPIEFVRSARKTPTAWIDIEKPFWWDVPIWLAHAQCDSIGLANNHMCRSSMYPGEAWGKPRDADRLPAPHGNGLWTQEIYYHILNCGRRLPPSAGSASGVLPNPVGYNRVYVHLPNGFTHEAWWQGLKAGNTFVTNGPLLVCSANGKLPGHIFQSPSQMEIELSGKLLGNDEIDRLEIIQNGKSVQHIDVSNARTDFTAKFVVSESGWFLVCAIANNPKTFRFASTAPFYAEVGAIKNRISRTSAAFFRDWVAERSARVSKILRSPEKLQEVLRYHEIAQSFWKNRLDNANSD